MTEVLDPTPVKDLSPKKFIFHGHVRFGQQINFNANAFQSLATTSTVKCLFDLVVDFFGVQAEVADVEEAFSTYLSNTKLLTVKTRVQYDGEDLGPATIESNGGRYPSCSLDFNIPNPLWDDTCEWEDNWTINFEYRKGKWAIHHTDKTGPWNGNKRYPKTRPQMLDLVDKIRALRSEV